MIEFLQSVGGAWGMGAVFAVILFFVLMRVMKHYTDQMRRDRQFMEDRLTSVIDAFNTVIQENIKIQSEVLTWLKARNGHG